MKVTDNILAQAGLTEKDLDEMGRQLVQQVAEAEKMLKEFPENEAIQKQAAEIIQKSMGTFQRLVARLKEQKQNKMSTPVPTPAKEEASTKEQRPQKKTEESPPKMQVVKSPFEPQNSNQEEGPIEVEVEEIPNQGAKAGYKPGPMSDFAEQYETDIDACREKIREENRRKREIREAEEGPKPKVSTVVRLQRKILGILSVMPKQKKHDPKALQVTETMLSDLLVGLGEAWGLKISKKVQKEGQDKFNDLNQKSTQ